MKKELKDLDKALNQTRLHNIKFGQRNKDAVYRKIQQKQIKRETPFKMGFVSLLTITVMAGLLFALMNFTNHDIEPLKQDTASPVSDERMEEPALQQPADPGELSKEELLNRMLNSIDYYDNVKGSAEIFRADSNGGNIDIDFQWDVVSGKCYMLQNDKDYTVCDGTQIHHTTNNIIESVGVSGTERKEEGYMSIEERIVTLEIGGKEEQVVNKRNDYPPTPYLFPQELMTSYLMGNEHWEKRETEKILGRPTIQIKGTINKHLVDTFHVYVDRSTGVILEYELFKDGETVEKYWIKEIHYNKEMDESLFKKSIIEKNMN